MIDPLRNIFITAMTDEAAAAMGFKTKEEKEEFLRQEREAAREHGERAFRETLERVCGKDTRGIPRGDYCYESCVPEDKQAELEECEKKFGASSPEVAALWVEFARERRCPYQQHTDHGTVICHFLEEEALGFEDGDEEKAVAFFGSEEETEKKCTGSILLYDAVRECEGMIKALENKGY